MPENENNDDVMNGDLTNLPEGDADVQGAEDGEEGTVGDEMGGDVQGAEDGEEGTVGDEMGDDMTVGDEMGGDMVGGYDMLGGGMGEIGTETGVKDPILSSIPFVSITIGAALAVGIVLGILLGRKRIKKGFDLYEN